MPTWIALLRAVNVGGRNMVSMPRLREALAADSFGEVQTYVQSGNIVVQSPLRSSVAVEKRIGALIAKEFDLTVPVVARTPAQLAEVIDGNPYPAAADERPKMLHVTFLAGDPAADGVTALHGDELTKRCCRVAGRHLYVDYVDGVHGSKLTPVFFARRLGVEGTARNWRTVLAIAELAG
ncbi:MAG TPA: DUF1697 domain-containing protein [Nocardioidaceae bacterium]|nr:DUF1697 domain-containing protein [Nocardioidaceae bacterium]